MSPDGDLNNPAELNGMNAFDSDGGKIGSVGQVYFDDRTGRPEWVTVKTGMFGMKESLVPLSGSHRSGEGLHLPYDKDTVKDAPRLDADQHLDPGQERQLYQYYGITRTGTGTGEAGMAKDRGTGDTDMSKGTGRGAAMADPDVTAAGAAPAATRGTAASGARLAAGSNTGEELIRSEEQLHVSTEEEAVGTARLRKIVVTENFTTSVPVTHEEVRVVHEPIAADDHTADRTLIGEAETEVVLHAEKPVIRKEAVAVERVRMETEKVTEQREVSSDLRKEQIEYDSGEHERGSGGGRRGPRH
jgi:uncharacterized protein (TIGR02271 family)